MTLITLDMGGTSTEVCLATAGRSRIAAGAELGDLPVRTPVLEITTIDAEGGSRIRIRIDDTGMLRASEEEALASRYEIEVAGEHFPAADVRPEVRTHETMKRHRWVKR